jgi:hypothetical protein
MDGFRILRETRKTGVFPKAASAVLAGILMFANGACARSSQNDNIPRGGEIMPINIMTDWALLKAKEEICSTTGGRMQDNVRMKIQTSDGIIELLADAGYF